MSSICIFEDEGYKKLLPLTWFKPSFDMRCGISTLFEKIKRNYPRTNVYLLCRDYLQPTVKKSHPGTMVGKVGKEASILFINGRVLCDAEISKKIPTHGGDEIFECNGVIVAARVSKGNLEMMGNQPFTTESINYFMPIRNTAKISQVTVKTIERFHDLIAENKEEIKNDFSFLTRGGITRGKMHQTVAVYQRGSIFIDDGADVDTFVTLDARLGPIFISKGAKILPYSRIEGPCFIGERSTITAHANIRTGVSIGNDSKVGGEVEETIFHSRSNKQHLGFLGHSYVGEWVNIGAGATNSDLKNNYGNIKVQYNNEEYDSGRMFLGCAIADHSKIGIGVLINTGSVIGAASNVFGGGLTHKFIPSFSWGNSHKLIQYEPEKAIKTAKLMMGRRDIDMDDADIDLFRKVFELTEEERKNAGIT
jgi:UDP-N-acetylglucosamine diphosphorylase / glucose-1-phosphate thymidylyltransferase / UDP-N-acetylgalactosamine diphosphorylase / glucosamine-1-phosphate N-acetyltransferase / galactosamine-1-phosphate N-acetyltransferase